jgi:hypothetical protein
VSPPQGRHFVEAIQSAMGRFHGRLHMIMVVLANNKLNTYSDVKKYCSIDYDYGSKAKFDFYMLIINNYKC